MLVQGKVGAMQEVTTTEEQGSGPVLSTGCKHHPDFQLVKPTCKCQRLLWPRRIHALVGMMFTGFLVVHLSICLTGLQPALFQRTVDWVEASLSHLHGLVLFGIFLPFLVQAVIGLYLLQHHGLKYNVKKCNRGGKTRFFLQRVSGLVILAFFLIHVGTLHEWGLHLIYRMTGAAVLLNYSQGGLFHAHGTAFSSTVLGLNRPWSYGQATSLMDFAIFSFGALGIWLTAFHVGNGSWSGGLVWKVAGTKIDRRLWAAFCWTVGSSIFLLGALSLYVFAFSSPARSVLSR
jgi:succinate dehydrogenase/fumarate reductase cytochrome b subunit